MKRTALVLLLAGLVCLAFASEPEAKESDIPDGASRNAFLPGISASFINQFGDGRLYPGASFHYAFVQGVTRSRSRGDFGGYYEWYAEIGFFKELASSMTDDIFFTCASGVNLSFEKFIGGTRNFLVPYFGAKAGGVFFNKGSGATFVEPVLGLGLWHTDSILVNYDCGLMLNTTDLTGRIGLHQSLVISFNL